MINDGIGDSILGQAGYGAFAGSAVWNGTQVNGLILQRPDGRGWRWDDGNGGPLTITYSFRGDPGCFYDPTEYGPRSEATGQLFDFDAEMVAGVEAALRAWESCANVDFVRVSEPIGPNPTAGDIRFGLVRWDGFGFGTLAHAYGPNGNDAGLIGDVWVNVDSLGSRFARGTEDFATIVHEVGHAVFGFADVSSYTYGNGTRYTGLNGARIDGTVWDDQLWTVMSYWRGPVPVATPMYLDILAAQAVYGPPTPGTPGDSSGNSAYSVMPHVLQTVWDTGGIDTLVWDSAEAGMINLNTAPLSPDATNPTGSVLGAFRLAEENRHIGWSGINDGSFDEGDWRCFIAPGTWIENASGGGGADIITGNILDNVIRGFGGNDVIDGGAGTDTAAFTGVRANYRVTRLANGDILVADQRTGTAPPGFQPQVVTVLDGTDTLRNIERIAFADGTLTVEQALDGAPRLAAVGANGVLMRAENNAVVTTLAASSADATALTYSIAGGADAALFTIDAASGALSFKTAPDFELPADADRDNRYVVTVRASGGSGFDEQTITITVTDESGATPTGGDGNNDQLVGTAEPDSLRGLGGNDTLDGGAGRDVLIGGPGTDRMAGGTGDDVYSIDSSLDQVLENSGEGQDVVYTSATFTLPDNVEGLVLVEGAGAINGTGSGGNDTIFGNAADNVLNGGGGGDALIGGGGNDVLNGGAAVDGMAGGAGNDVYAVDTTCDQIQEQPNEGEDVVYASAHFSLAENVEGMVLVEGAGAIHGNGNGGDNYLFGNTAANRLDGAGGNDVLFAGGGDDVLIGGDGADVMVGGDGNDLFAFAPGYFGHDTITDFATGDRIVFDHRLFADFADVRAHLVQVAGGIAIVSDSGNALMLQHVVAASLTASDFLFS